MNDHDNTNLDKRVSDLEGDVKAVGIQVSEVKSGLDELKVGQSRLEQAFNSSRQTPLVPIITTAVSCISLIVIIGGLTLAPIYHDLQEGKQERNVIEKEFLEHVRDGHPQRIEDRITSLEKRVVDLDNKQSSALIHMDDVLQREMRILDDVMLNEISNLDTVLQREMRLLLAADKEDREHLFDLIEELDEENDRGEQRDMQNSADDANQDARIKVLEKQIME